jgi:peroxiredoxin
MSTPTTTAVGTAMPDVALVAPDGSAATLHGVRAGGPAVVYFLRAAGCPVCVRHARGLAALVAQGRLTVPVVLVVPGAAGDAAELARRLRDAAGTRGVTVWASGTGHAAAGLGTFLTLQHSGTFLVGADGTVGYRRAATVPTQSYSERELLAALAG